MQKNSLANLSLRRAINQFSGYITFGILDSDCMNDDYMFILAVFACDINCYALEFINLPY